MNNKVQAGSAKLLWPGIRKLMEKEYESFPTFSASDWIYPDYDYSPPTMKEKLAYLFREFSRRIRDAWKVLAHGAWLDDDFGRS